MSSQQEPMTMHMGLPHVPWHGENRGDSCCLSTHQRYGLKSLWLEQSFPSSSSPSASSRASASRGQPQRRRRRGPHRANLTPLLLLLLVLGRFGLPSQSTAGRSSASSSSSTFAFPASAASSRIMPLPGTGAWTGAVRVAGVAKHPSETSVLVSHGSGGDEGQTVAASTVMAVRDAIYAALFGAPEPGPEDSVGMSELSETYANVDEGGILQSASSLARRAFESSGIPYFWNAVASKLDAWKHSAAAAEVEGGEALAEDHSIASAMMEAKELQEEEVTSSLSSLVPASLASMFPDPSANENQFVEFFLFIKDYSWSLRYRVSRTDDGHGINTDKPLIMEWVKLRKPLTTREELKLASTNTTDLFMWDVREPPRHQGFMYQVTQAVGSGVEAVINFFKGRGLNFLVQTNGIKLMRDDETDQGVSEVAQAEDGNGPIAKPVTHCWVQVVGLPFFPVLQSIAFFNAESVVMDWSA